MFDLLKLSNCNSVGMANYKAVISMTKQYKISGTDTVIKPGITSNKPPTIDFRYRGL